MPASIPDYAANSMPADIRLVYDWLADNGVDEWLPEDVWVDIAGGQLTYLSYVWTDGRRGWDGQDIVVEGKTVDDYRWPTEERTVPLKVSPTDAVRQAFTARRVRLTEEQDPS